MMQDLGWEQRQARWKQYKTVMVNRVVNNFVEIPASQYLTPTGVSFEATNNDSHHITAQSTPTRVPSSHRRSDSGMPCWSVQYMYRFNP